MPALWYAAAQRRRPYAADWRSDRDHRAKPCCGCSGGRWARDWWRRPNLDLGQLRGGDTARAKLRLANNGTALLTGSATVAQGAPWLNILSGASIYCAAGAVESLDLQISTKDLSKGRHVGKIQLDTTGAKPLFWSP